MHVSVNRVCDEIEAVPECLLSLVEGPFLEEKIKDESDRREKRLRMAFEVLSEDMPLNNGRSVGRQAAIIDMPISTILQ